VHDIVDLESAGVPAVMVASTEFVHAAASQSGRLTREEIRLQAEIGPLVWAVHELPDQRDRVDAEHARLIEAIEAADAAGARDVAESHVSNAVERLIERRLAL